MKSFDELAASVMFTQVKGMTKLIKYDPSLDFIGEGRSAVVFRIQSSDYALKVFFPNQEQTAIEEAEIYQQLQTISYFPTIYGSGHNYIVIDYIEGITLFDCLRSGIRISPEHIQEADHALAAARESGLNPSDIHLKNIMITKTGEIKLIDVARFRQIKNCSQWDDIKLAYFRFYKRIYSPKGIPDYFLNMISNLYKKPVVQKWFAHFYH
ncbi:putative Ser/Thr protein kinase [Bacillus mesophilus]|uniref:Protein kinase family protein n=1 Tax=Bacillus mesophilus TaxID=1808955 RepID=A0A6M0Q728_9BACI|nr:protein kinase family protein [Bacillus mesophilus]MBM7661495.1 putative Ser/Thr protein kinase [Bacillus mesophilus]NEY72166.1 protein kinase family protein [Bacillus mesophilus]